MFAITRFLPLLLVIVLGMALMLRLVQMQAPQQDYATYSDPMLGQAMPELTLHPLFEGEPPLELASLRGQAYLFNIYASWCAPCQAEHPVLQSLAEKSGLPLYGMAWKDTPEASQRWLARMGNIYKRIGVDTEGKTSIMLGMTGVPETYMVDETGRIIAVFRGALNEAVIDSRFLPALAHVRSEQPASLPENASTTPDGT